MEVLPDAAEADAFVCVSLSYDVLQRIQHVRTQYEIVLHEHEVTCEPCRRAQHSHRRPSLPPNLAARDVGIALSISRFIGLGDGLLYELEVASIGPSLNFGFDLVKDCMKARLIVEDDDNHTVKEGVIVP